MIKLLKVGLLAATTLAGALSATVSAAQETIRFAVTDIDGLESLQTEMGPFKDAFEAASGLKVDFFAVSGRTIAVEAMAADQVDQHGTGTLVWNVRNPDTGHLDEPAGCQVRQSCARAIGELVGMHVIPRPHDDLDKYIAKISVKA